MNQENSRETNKEEIKYFCCFLNWQKGKRGENIYNIKHSFYLVLDLGKVLMIGTLQWFHRHEQHMFKVDPNISISHPSHLLSQILYKVKILN